MEKTVHRHRSYACFEFPHILCHGLAFWELQKSISRERRNICVCPFHTGFRTLRSFDADDFQIDTKDLN